jgi:antibiotic biosynthesis monooxygenase (ABM) superfamily enzyme
MAAEHLPQSRATTSAVHEAIVRVVRPGCESEFESLIQKFFVDAAQHPGVAGAYLLRPFEGAATHEYGIVRSFNSAEDRDRFYTSDLYRRWSEAVAPLVEGEPKRQHLHGMEAFFPGNPAPPAWKMALLTWVGVDVAVYAFSTAVPAIAHLPAAVTFLLVNALVVATLTWILMPLLTKIFEGWLRPSGA